MGPKVSITRVLTCTCRPTSLLQLLLVRQTVTTIINSSLVLQYHFALFFGNQHHKFCLDRNHNEFHHNNIEFHNNFVFYAVCTHVYTHLLVPCRLAVLCHLQDSSLWRDQAVVEIWELSLLSGIDGTKEGQSKSSRVTRKA